MTTVSQAQPRDPVHFDQGVWWFADETWTRRYGPYPDEVTARGQLEAYTAWRNTTAGEQSGSQGEAESEITRAARRYDELREKKSEMAARHKAELATIEEELKEVDRQLLTHLNQLGVDSVKAGGLTVYTQTELRSSIGDKGAFMDFIRATGQPELLQSRISSTTLKEYMEKNGGQLPPGVTTQTERVIRVRKN